MNLLNSSYAIAFLLIIENRLDFVLLAAFHVIFLHITLAIELKIGNFYTIYKLSM